MEAEGYVIIALIICIAIAGLLGLIVTSIFSDKNARVRAIDGENEFLETLINSTSCACNVAPK